VGSRPSWRRIWRRVAEDLELGVEPSPTAAGDVVIRGPLQGIPLECAVDVKVSRRHPEGAWWLPAFGPVTRVRAFPRTPPPEPVWLEIAPPDVRGDDHIAQAWMSPALRELLGLTSGWRFVVRGGHVWAYAGRIETDPLRLASAMRGVAALALRGSELGNLLHESAVELGATRSKVPWRADGTGSLEIEVDGVVVRIYHPLARGKLETRAVVRWHATPEQRFVLAEKGQPFLAKGERVELPVLLAEDYEAWARDPERFLARLTPEVARDLRTAAPAVVVGDPRQILLRAAGFVTEATRLRAIADAVCSLANPRTEAVGPYR
jgi:hypothetical protein